jgi:uncharacterized protein YlbG (UPF0298 family)
MIKNLFVNNLGSLRDFSNVESQFPKGKIIIHGMNGSGKSQLSSVLQKISKLRVADQIGQSHSENIKREFVDYFIKRKSREASSDANIEAKVDDFNFNIDVANRSVSYNGNFPKLFVFNEEYVLENVGDTVSLPDKTIRIGEKNQERDDLQNAIKSSELALKKVRKSIDDLVQTAKNETGFDGQSRTAKIISVENYLLNENPGEENKEARNQLEKLSNPPDPINFHISIQKPKYTILEEDQSEIETIFSNTYLEPKLTKEFYSSFIKTNKKFYADGVTLFKAEKRHCPFCLTPKQENDSNILELIEYIDSTYNEKLEIVANYHSNLKNHQEKLINFLNQWNSHINNINEKAKLLAIEEKIDILLFPNDEFEKLLGLVKRKIEDMSLTNSDFKISDSICSDIDFILMKISEDYEHQMKFIKEINVSIEKISGKKRTLGEQIIKHYMYELWCKNSLRERKIELEKDIKAKQERYSEISASISNDRTIDFFNQIIKILGISKYELNDDSSIILKIEDDYDISQEGFRISTGERKFIAMSYFFAEVLASVENSTELKNISIIIDDPIDSSDYQKFYSFISVIENFDSILQAIYKNTEIELGQFIILTHNALLYERLINSKSVCEYLLLQENNKTKIIKPKRPISLITFSSYLRKVTGYIKQMERSNNKEIGNYIRRILEIIASIENVDNNKIQNLNASSKLNALANHLSHESLERILDPLPETHEYIEACIELIEEIKRRIPALYFTIIKKYLDEKEIEEYRVKYNELHLN